jgi:hypothetical protein
MPSRQETEALLHRLVGVRAVRIDWADSTIERVHVISDGRRPPRGLVRDIVGTLARQCGLTVGSDQVHVVELRPEWLSPPAGRIRLMAVGWREDEGHTRMVCRLAYGDQEEEGQAEDPDGLRAASLAALAAVEQIVGTRAGLYLADHRVVDTSAGPLVVVVIGSAAGERLSGSAFGDHEMFAAGVRAVLDAVNRQVDRWLRPAGEGGPNGE